MLNPDMKKQNERKKNKYCKLIYTKSNKDKFFDIFPIGIKLLRRLFTEYC